MNLNCGLAHTHTHTHSTGQTDRKKELCLFSLRFVSVAFALFFSFSHLCVCVLISVEHYCDPSANFAHSRCSERVHIVKWIKRMERIDWIWFNFSAGRAFLFHSIAFSFTTFDWNSFSLGRPFRSSALLFSSGLSCFPIPQINFFGRCRSRAPLAHSILLVLFVLSMRQFVCLCHVIDSLLARVERAMHTKLTHSNIVTDDCSLSCMTMSSIKDTTERIYCMSELPAFIRTRKKKRYIQIKALIERNKDKLEMNTSALSGSESMCRCADLRGPVCECLFSTHDIRLFVFALFQ